jgi:homoserine dehydrogenase
METRPVKVAIIGAGTVGAALVAMLRDSSRAAALHEAVGDDIEIVGVAVRDVTKARPGVPAELLAADPLALVSREDVDIVVELAGGVDDAYRYVKQALESGKSVVTANKALIAAKGTELEAIARAQNVDLIFEAAVAGGIPILRALRTSLVGEKIHRVMGIVNGTTNFILSAMTADGASYDDVLAEAQRLGYAEADPTADVEGFDAAAKVTILAALSFGTPLVGATIAREGISSVTADDVAFATRHGYVIKLIGVAERVGEHGISMRVHPAMLPISHPLASINGAFNAVFVEGAKAGPLMLMGRGAGGDPTASAVLGDILEAARNRLLGRRSATPDVEEGLSDFPLSELQNTFYLTIDVADKPGVLAAVTAVFGDHGVSIRLMEQSGFGDEARLTFVTHHALESDMSATIEDLQTLDVVDAIGTCLRILGEDA